MPIAGDSGKVPGPPGTQDHVPKQQCQDRGQQRHCRVQDRVQLGVILVTALEKQSELGEKNRNANGRLGGVGPFAEQYTVN